MIDNESTRWAARTKLLDERARVAAEVLSGRRDADLALDLPAGLPLVLEQLARVDAKWGRTYASRHEMAAVLREECDELWDEVRRDGANERVAAELVDVACVALRALRQMSEEAAR